MPRVILSSGHTERSPGTEANGLREVDVARDIVKATLPYLRQNGIISLSVPPDQDMQNRILWINKSGYSEQNNDITIEVHINDGGGTGLEGWFEGDGNNSSSKLVNAVLRSTSDETGLKNLGSKSEYDHELGSLAFLHETLPIAALIECGFIDNEKDAAFLKQQENIEKIGKGIAKGILQYYGMEFREAGSQRPAATSVPQSVTAPVRDPAPAPQPAARPDPGNAGAPVFPPAGGGFNTGGFNSPAAGGFGGNSFGGPAAPQSGGGGFTPMPSREERKEMITKTYVKILGREPNQNDLNYFLNIGITEDQLLKKMVDSQEHADLVKARQEVITAKKNYNDQQTELIRLRNQVNDNQQILNNLQHSIQEKNRGLAELQQRISQYERINAAKPQSGASEGGRSQKYTGSFVDRLFRAFSDLFD